MQAVAICLLRNLSSNEEKIEKLLDLLDNFQGEVAKAKAISDNNNVSIQIF